MRLSYGNPVSLSHEIIKAAVTLGDTVVDATAGNGKDTLFLAKIVGSSGRVIAFDCQMEAIQKTQQLLEQNGVSEWVRLIAAGHQHLAQFIFEPVKAVMFNLGYLPGGDKKAITTPENTICAIENALRLLLVNGAVSIVVYPGHPGGKEEAQSVIEYLQGLSPKAYLAVRLDTINRKQTSPYLIAVYKIAQI